MDILSQAPLGRSVKPVLKDPIRRSVLQVHLFDIDIPGKITFKESETLSPGPGGTVVDTDAGRLGVAICYDLRFPELAMMYARRGVQLIIYPGRRHRCLFS